MNTYSNRQVANHLHGLIFELKERMNSRQDRPVMRVYKKNNICCTKCIYTIIKRNNNTNAQCMQHPHM